MKEAVKSRGRFSFPQKLMIGGALALLVAAVSFKVFIDLTQIACPRSRPEGEIAALSTAIYKYAADHGHVPSNAATDELRTTSMFNPDWYIPASQCLYKALSGDSDGDPKTTSPNDTKVYFEFKPDMLRQSPSGSGVYIVDSFGNSIGYSTCKAKHPKEHGGYNYSFDLWSTSGNKTQRAREKWVSNW